MKEKISTEQELDCLLSQLFRQPERPNLIDPQKNKISVKSESSAAIDVKSEEKEIAKSVYRLDLTERCIEIVHIDRNGDFLNISRCFTPQNIEELKSLKTFTAVNQNGAEILIPSDKFCFSDNGLVMLYEDAIYKCRYGVYYECQADKHVRKNTVLYKTELYGKNYVFCRDLLNKKMSFLGSKFSQVNKNCFKVWLADQWHVYFFNHVSFYKIDSGSKIIGLADGKIKCVDYRGKFRNWVFKTRSPKCYIPA